MESDDIIPVSLRGSSLERSLRDVESIYTAIDRAEAGFRESAAKAGKPLSCPAGCGSCCEGFVPDVLPLEAAYLAAYILGSRPELAHRPLSGVPPCPFYDADRPEAHCSVYRARPLICRLFAFSAVSGKAEEPSFALCRRMPALPGSEARSWSGEALREAFGAAPPLMSAFAAELLGLDPDSTGERRLLAEALPRALAKVGLALSLAGMARGDDEPEPNEPEPDAPSPLAA